MNYFIYFTIKIKDATQLGMISGMIDPLLILLSAFIHTQNAPLETGRSQTNFIWVHLPKYFLHSFTSIP